MEQDKLQVFVMSVLIIGLTLVFGIYIAAQMQTVLRTTGVSVSTINESISAPTTAGITLDGGAALDGSCGTVVLTNGTTGTTIAAGNYTQSDCVITNKTTEFTAYDTVYATYIYTFTNDTTSSTASGSLVTSLDSGMSWVAILILIGFAIIVLGMLSEGLGKAASGQSESGLTY